MSAQPQPRVYESVIKVVVSDPPERRARDIAEGMGWAAILLRDEYGWAVEKIENLLAQVLSQVEEEG